MIYDGLEIFLFSSYFVDKIVNKSIANVEILNNKKKNNLEDLIIPRTFKISNTEYVDIENNYHILQRSKTWQAYDTSNKKDFLLQNLSQSNDNLFNNKKIKNDIFESYYFQSKYLKKFIDTYFNKHIPILKTEYGEEIIGIFLKIFTEPPFNIIYSVRYLEEIEWNNLKRLKYEINWKNLVSKKNEITCFNVELRNINRNIECSVYGTFGKGRMIRFEKGYYYIKRWIFNFANFD
ncbi:Hypothetical protein SRAE_2000150800 [Strongyloides ratti]|uniref:Uncharacterized protein n=1 Tax=Strongyloides ratti TaxID=34506 RepID=A0A090LAR2_STRRB|nr:Hypothetical protein SRAE_2000150800 [Strongyloides ratti]CEF66842.1 Hypothetical protein SRAE_2000150800 [Strongyloides ratti]